MKRVVFLIPPLLDAKKNPDRIFGCNYGFFTQHNIFLLYPATVLKKSGYEVSVIDCAKERIPLAEAIKEPADIYVFYSVFLSRDIDIEAAGIIEKTKGANTPIVFLGPDPTYFAAKYLASSNRLVIRGEPEESLLDLVNNLSFEPRQIAGVSWFFKGKVVENPPRNYLQDLDLLPFPERTLFKQYKAYNNAKFRQFPSTTILTSRGCAYGCYYCVPNSLSYARELEWKRFHHEKPPVRKRSTENVIAEFKEIFGLGFRSVSVIDDQFLWEKERTDKILDGIKDLNLEISILARPDLINDEALAKLMFKSGIRHVALGVESFSQEILDYIGKDLKVEAIEKAVRILKSVGINPEINILLGSCPLETRQTIENTIEKVRQLNIDIIHAQVCSPFPGTEFYYRAKEKKWMITDEYVPIDPAADALISYPHLSQKEMIKLIKEIHRSHYFNARYIWDKLIHIKSLGDIKEKARAAKRMWSNIIKS